VIRGALLGRTSALIIGTGAILVALNLAKGLVDSDGWWHLAAGRLIAEHGIPSADPFTFTWAGRPWTAHEWLSELLMYDMSRVAGIAGLAAVWSFIPLLTFGILIVTVRRLGAQLRAIAISALLCGLVFTTYVTLRPQPISWLLIAGLICILLTVRPPFAPWLVCLGPVFVVWANLHGLYVVGLGLLAVFIGFTLSGHTQMSSQRGWVALSGVAALAGTVATPAGIVGLLYPLRYLEAGDWGLGYIPEWNTPNFHEPAHLLLLVLISAVGLISFRRSPGWLSFIGFGSLVGCLFAMRVVPIAAVVCMPILAFGLDDLLPSRQSPLGPASRASGRPGNGRRLMDVGLALVIAVASYVVLVPKDLAASVSAEEVRRFPAAQIAILRQRLPAANVFAEYSWGGYVEYRLHDQGGRSFIDGRNDMFDQRILDDYSSIRAADPEWDQKLRGYGANAILLPPDAPLTHGPAQDAGWCEASRSELAVLLLRTCGGG
jgi:hypothetical protein